MTSRVEAARDIPTTAAADGSAATSTTGGAVTARALTFEDYLPLRTLYARFDAIAEGRAPGHSPSAHQAVLDRLAANQGVAQGLGWTECALERVGGRGRLIACGVRVPGGDREIIPDWVPARLRSTKPDIATTPEASPPPPVVSAADRVRHDELKATKRGWLMPASPPLLDGMFERVAKRLAAAAAAVSGRAAATRPPGPRGAASSARILGVDVEWAAESRWLDDGGR
jgi:hypothetical protein